MAAQVHTARPLSVVVAGNVRAEAARIGLQQAELADRIGLGRMSVSDRFRGRTPWGLDELEAVAEVLGVPVARLIACDDTRPAGELALGWPRAVP